MQYNFAENVSELSPSAIREMLKFAGIPGMISLAAGNPAPEAFPTNVIADISDEILRKDPIGALQYNITEGDPNLREILKIWMAKEHNFHPESDDLIITSGAQQANELSCKVLLNPGDTLLCESPSFIGSLNSFRSYGVNLVGVSMERDGMNMEELERKIPESPSPKLIYVIPNFQNPTGRVMSPEKRKQLYALAQRHHLIILEDDPYGELRFSGEAIPSIKSLDTDGRVIYSGSFSKILAPGLRVGYVIAPRDIIGKITVCKQVSDVHTNIWAQKICAEFLTRTDMDSYLSGLRAIYRHKCNLMADGIRAHFSPEITWEMPQGGLFIWATLPDTWNMPAFCRAAIEEEKVAIVSGASFLVDPSAKTQSIRLNYSTPSDAQIREGIEKLGALTKKFSKGNNQNAAEEK